MASLKSRWQDLGESSLQKSTNNVLLRLEHTGLFIAVIFSTLCALHLEIIVGWVFGLYVLFAFL